MMNFIYSDIARKCVDIFNANATNRYYHTLTHPVYMIAYAFTNNITLSEEQLIAVMLHDVIMFEDVSEEKSAALAYDFALRVGKQIKDATIIKQIILDTQHHIPTIPESEIVIDLDLQILSSDALTYKNYVSNIRKEYSKYSDLEFCKGRYEWIEKFLNRKIIYHVLKNLENVARYNLQYEKTFLELTVKMNANK